MYKNTKVDLLLYTRQRQAKKGTRIAKSTPLPPPIPTAYMGVSHKIFGRTGDAH